MQLITPPVPRDLLPPLIACLPTAFVSPKPPPALLPLLSPILRQRVNLLTGNSTGTDGWLPLLSWDPQRASKLASKIEGLQLEPHPVSGELELEDVKRIQFRRLDEETLHSRLEVDEFDLLPVYVWCSNDDDGAGWRLAELRALEDGQDGTQWSDSIAAATDRFESTSHPVVHQPATNGHGNAPPQEDEDEDDDDDYWASYDRTPGGPTPARTPAKHSPAPNTGNFNPTSTTAEQDYYARYGNEVQPALDNHDPDEETPETTGLGTSTLNGRTLLDHHQAPPSNDTTSGLSPPPYSKPQDSALATTQHSLYNSNENELPAPRPQSPSSLSSSNSVERLEQTAADMTRAEVGVKQFISTEIKSLFRLARSVGIERAEFDRIVRTEVDVLGMMEADD